MEQLFPSYNLNVKEDRKKLYTNSFENDTNDETFDKIQLLESSYQLVQLYEKNKKNQLL